MDKYDEQIDLLTKNPEMIGDHWMNGWGLFQYLTPTGRVDESITMGCPTLVKARGRKAATPELMEAVAAADIPDDEECIKPVHLPAFAAIQRLADTLLGREG